MGANAKRHILVTLQTGFTHKGVLADLLQAMRDSPDDWQWWVRLHPVDVDKRSYVRRLLEESKVRNFTLEPATDLPLYALLRQMDVHVTHSSSTVLEAETFSVPSVLVSQYGMERYPEQIRSGWAVSASSSTQILAAVQEQLERKSSLSTARPVDSFSSAAFHAVLNLLGQTRTGTADRPEGSADPTGRPSRHAFS
jgi:UDP-N-acetylglucosamine 2-epimerase